MKKLLLSAAVLLFAVGTLSASMLVVKDTAVYAETANYTFENLWIQSRYSVPVSFPSDGYGLAGTNSRGMAGKDGKILICRREAAGTLIEKYMNKSNILVYDGATGALEKTIPVPDSLFHQKDVASDTLRAIGFPSNDIQVDAAGNVILMSMTTNLAVTPFVVAALKVDLVAGTVTQAKRILNKNYPDIAGVRFDTFNVYGDMFGNGFFMAPVSGTTVGVSDMVIRWNVSNGVTDENFVPIQIKKYVPSKTAKFNDTAPRVKPISETLFYLDGQQSYATLYDMDGNLVDSIRAAVYPASPGNNGVDEFTIGSHNFVVYSHANTAVAPHSSWAVAELGTGMSLVDMERLYIFPKGGMGNTSNAVRTAVPYIEVIGNSAFIYVYGQANGLGAYKLTLKPTGLNNTNTSSVKLTVSNKQLVLSEEVNSIEVFAMTGQKVRSAVHVNQIAAPAENGIYLVNMKDKNGLTKVEKVVIR
ncbi:MAG: T9SS type A sorting domain-containing protein [Paludibacter sp.]|nr:T9SS type A sorting domain-containing protein [Paludibacter sp.]